MRTFTIKQAKEIIKHYSNLVGECFDESCCLRITELLICPYDGKQYSNFIKNYARNDDYEKSLLLSGFDPENVEVMVVYHDRTRNILVHNNIDNYLTKMKLPKVYEDDLSKL